MESSARLSPEHHPDAFEFVRFCRGRRAAPWPEIYDEMWAVAAGGHFRGYSFDELEERGIGFGLAQIPRLAELVQQVIAADPRPRPVPTPRRSSSPSRRGLAIIQAAPHPDHGGFPHLR